MINRCKCGQPLLGWRVTDISGSVDVYPSGDEPAQIFASSEAEARCYIKGIRGYVYPHDVKVPLSHPRVRRLGLCRIGVWLRSRGGIMAKKAQKFFGKRDNLPKKEKEPDPSWTFSHSEDWKGHPKK